MSKTLKLAICALAMWGVSAASQALAGHNHQGFYMDGVFDQQYATPVGNYGASIYPSPRPVPYNVGQTMITYPPLAPHNFMRRHMIFSPGHKTFVRYR